MLTNKLLLCTDMDRTLLPNGAQPESSHARAHFAKFVECDNVTLAYVTGRNLALVQEAIAAYQLPIADYLITDVGTQIYHYINGSWQASEAWSQEIDKDWRGRSHGELAQLFQDIDVLTMQAAEHQNTHKLSYDVKLDANITELLAVMNSRLESLGVHASLVWSIDEEENKGLLDVLPRNATKLHAVEFLRQQLNYELSEVVFCGDSGNDLAVMSSAVPSVLVANASEDVRVAALDSAKHANHSQALYLATGDHLGMNGNYSAGILEGVWHFIPGLRADLESIIAAAQHHG